MPEADVALPTQKREAKAPAGGHLNPVYNSLTYRMIQRLPLLLGWIFLGLLSQATWAQSTIFLPPTTQNPSCNGLRNGSIVFSVQGVATDFFLSWSGGNLPTNGNPISGDGVLSQTGLGAGTYSIFILDNVSGLDTTVNVVLTNPPFINLDAGDNVAICQGQGLNLSATSNAASGSTVVWTYTNANGLQTFSGFNVSVPGSPSPQAITNSLTINILLTDPSGCTASDQVSVTVNPIPVGTANPASQSICTGPVSIALNSSLPGTNFIWTVTQSGAAGATGGNGTAINQNVRATGATNGTITYNIRPVSSAGCIGTVFQSLVTVRPKPTLSANPDSSSICSGGNTNVALSSNVSNASFAWRAIPSNVSGSSNGNGPSIAQNLSTNSAGGRVIYRAAASFNGCISDSARIVVSVLPVPTVSVIPADTLDVCAGQSATINYTSSVSGSAFDWLALPNGAGAISGTGSNNVQTYQNAGSQTIRVNFQVRAIANGCTSALKNHRVRVRPIPVLTINSADDTLCSGQSTNISLSSNVNGSVFNWTSLATGLSGNAPTGTGSPITNTLATTGNSTGTVQYTVAARANGCNSPTQVKTIVVHPIPVGNVNPPRLQICSGETPTLALSSNVSGTQFSWTVQAGNISGANPGAGSSISQTLVNNGPGLDSVVYTISPSFNGCNGQNFSAILRVLPNPKPIVSVSAFSICSGESINISITNPGNWSWLVDGQGINGALPGSGNSINQTLSLIGPGDRNLVYKIFEANGICTSDTARVAIRVRSIPQIQALVENNPICSGQTARIFLSSTPADSTQFSWLATAQNVSGASDGNGNQIEQTLNLVSGNAGQAIYAISANRLSCTASRSDTIEVETPNIPFTATALSNTICSGNPAQISIQSSIPGVTFSWTINASNISGASPGNGNSIEQLLSLTGPNGFVDYVITPNNGTCNGLPQTVRINVQAAPPKPTITISGGSSPICPGQSLSLTSNQLFGNQWYRNGIAIPAPIGNQRTLVVSDSGWYRLVFTASLGCSSPSDSIRIDIQPTPPKPIISGNAGFCPGGNVRLRSSSASNNQWLINGSDINGATDTVLVVTLGGNYSVRVTGPGCPVSSEIFTVTAFSNPPQPSISGNNFICSGDTGILQSTPAFGYQWIRNNTELLGETNQSLSITIGGNYQVRITDSTGCQATSNIFNVQQIGAVGRPNISGNNSFCPGDSTILTTNNSNPAWKNQWFKNGLLLPGDTLRTLVVKDSGSYTVSLTSPRGCSNISLPFRVSIRPGAPVPIISGLPLLCPGGQNTLVSSAPTGNIWFLNGNQITGANNPTYLANEIGSYTVQVTTEQGCRAVSVAFQISNTTDVQAIANFSDPSICGGTNGSISVSASGGSGQYRYTWTPSGGNIVQGQAAQSGLSAGVYSVVVVDSLSGCGQGINGIVLTDPASFTATPNVTNVSTCGANNGAISLSITGSNGPFTFQWTGPRTSTNQNINNLPAGFYTVRITETTTGCVLILDSIEVGSPAPPKPNLIVSGNLEFCTGDSVILSTTASGLFQWFRNNVAIAGATNDSLIVNSTANYFVRVSGASANCFSRSDTVRVTVNALPGNPSIGGSGSTVCQGISVSLTSNSNLSKQWILDGVDIPGATGNFLEVSTGGVYCLRVTDANGCSRTSSTCRTVIINPLPPSPVISGILGFCPGGSTSLSFAPIDTANYTYTWLRNNNFVSNSTNGILSVNLGGWYKVRAVDRVTSCRIFGDSVFVENFTNPPAPTISGAPSICVGSSTYLVSSQAATYKWFRNGVEIADSNNDSLRINEGGIYSVSITDFNGCGSSSVGFVVGELPVPIASTISGDSTFCAGSNEILTASANANYQWLFNGIPLLGQNSQTISATLFGDYQVVVSNTLGCTDTSLAFQTEQGPANFTLDTVLVSTSCVSGNPQNNGSISVSASGGSGNYTYEWTPALPPVSSQGNLSPGIYSVVVSDQATSCIVALQNLEIKGIPALSLSSSIQNDSRCDVDNGQISIQVSGGSGNYTYQWLGFTSTDTALLNLGEGLYTVEVTDQTSACNYTFDSLAVAGVDTFQAQSNLTQPTTCGGFGLIAISSTGGSGFFSYNWTGGGSGILQGAAIQSTLTAGTFSVSVQDTVSRCLRILSDLVLLENGNLNIAFESSNPSTCGGNEGRISAITNLPNASYSWRKNGLALTSTDSILTNQGIGNYEVIVRLGSCIDSVSIALSSPGLDISAEVDSISGCGASDGAITLTVLGLGSNPGFAWMRNNQTFSSIQNLNNLAGGQYKIKIQSAECLDSAEFNLNEIFDFNLSVSVDSADCKDSNGVASIAVSQPLTNPVYTWKKTNEPGFSATGASQNALQSGSYRVLVASGLCLDSIDFVVPKKQDCNNCDVQIQLLPSQPTACGLSNGQIIANVSGLSNPQFIWKEVSQNIQIGNDDTLSGIGGGIYRLIVSDALCKDSMDIILENAVPFTIGFVVDSATCADSDGSVSVNLTNASNAALYQILRLPGLNVVATNQTAQNLASGSYRIRVVDGNCSDSTEVSVLKPGNCGGCSLAISALADSASCADNDGSIALTVNGGSPLTIFSWTKIGSPTFSANTQNIANLSTGTYKIVAQEGICKDSLFVIVGKPINCGGCNLQVIVSSNPVTCAGISNGTAYAFVTSGGIGPFNYQLNNNPPLTLPQFLVEFADQPSGPFSVVVEDQTTLCQDTVSGFIGTQLSLSASAFTNNPGCGQNTGSIRVVVAGAQGPFTITIGSTALVTQDGDTTFTGLPAGTYVVSIVNAQGCATSIENVVLVQPQPIAIALGPITSASCSSSSDGSIQISTLSGGSNYQYFIPGVTSGFQPISAGQTISNLRAGSYLLSLRAQNACDIDTQIVVPALPSVQIGLGTSNATSCRDSSGSVKIQSLNGGAGNPWTFQLWNQNALVSSGILPADSTFRNLFAGDFQLLVSDSNACTDTALFNIQTEQTSPAVSILADKLSICTGDTVTIAASNTASIDSPVFTWYKNGKALTISGNQWNVDSLANGDSVQVKITGFSECLNPDSAWSNFLKFKVLPPNLQAQADIEVIKNEACIGQSAILKALNTNQLPNPGYRWIVNGITLPTDTNQVLNLFPGLPVNQVRAIVFNRNVEDCISKISDTSEVVQVVQVEPLVASDSLKQISPLPGQLICANTPVTFALKSNLKNKISIAIQWWRNDSLIATSQDTFYTFNALANGARIKAVAVFDTSLSCISANFGPGKDSTKTQTINVLPASDIRCKPCSLIVNVNPSNINCAGASSGAITVSASGGSGGYKYSLLPSGPTNQALPFFFGLNPGTYGILVRDTVTNCSTTVSNINLIVQNAYNVVVSGTNPSPCLNIPDGKLEFVSVSDGSNDAFKYKFRINPAEPYSLNRIFTGLSAGTYTMEVIDTISGCITEITRTLTAPLPLQAISFVNNGPSCYGQFNGQIVLDTVLNGSGFYQFSLSGDSGTYSSISLNNPFPLGFGAGSVQLYLKDVQSGCLDTINHTLIQPDSIELAASVVIQSQCFAPTGQIKMTAFSGGTGTLNISIKYPGSSVFLPLSIPPDSILTNLAGGDYVFQISDQNNCEKQILLNMPSNGPQIGNIRLVKPCRGDSNGVIVLGGISGGTSPYAFVLGNASGILKTQTDTVFAGLKPDSYVITIRDSSAPACEISYARQLTSPEPIRVNVVAVGSSSCENFDGWAKILLSGGQGAFRFSIDSLAGNFSAFKSWNGDTLLLRGLSRRPDSNPYILRILDGGPGQGCGFDTTFNIPGNSPLRFALRTKNLKCYGDNSGTLRLDSLNGTGPVILRVFNSQTGEIIKTDSILGEQFLNNQLELGGLPAGEFNLVVLQFGNCAASRIVNFSLSQPSQIEIFARAYKPSAEGFAMGSILLDSVRGSFKPYLVQFEEENAFSYVPDTLFDGLNPGIFTLAVSDSIGCQVSKEIEVLKDDALFVPSLFTPNGDGKNDRFEIRNLPPASKLEVRDRWGKEVFKSSDYQNDWDGKDQENGTYFWNLNIPGSAERNGWVQIMK